ncbi:ABC transporter permease [bacterium]|nr:ABC transporter permease [bacterium]
MSQHSPSHRRIILAIAGKDIVQAIRDKVTLGIMIGVLLLIVPSQLLPLILQNQNIPRAVVLAPNAHELAGELDALPDVRAYAVRTRDELDEAVLNGRGKVIGLAFPDGFAFDGSAGQSWTIEAYLPHWTGQEEINTLILTFTEKINALAADAVRIDAVEAVYPDFASRGFLTMFILQMVNALLTVTLVLVPQLIMSEKETHTLDAMLVSPATPGDLVIGKGLTGLFYALVAAVIVLLFNTAIIVHWGLLALTILSGAAFAVLLGLLVGLLFDNFQQTTLFQVVILALSIAPAFINLVLTVDLPAMIDNILTWLPGGRLAALLQMSLMKTVNWPSAGFGLGAIWLVNLILLGLILFRLRREMD